MKRMVVALVAISLLPAAVPTETASQSLSGAQTIRAKDGDVILVENNDKVKIVHRRHANVRILYNAAQRWVLVLADFLSPGAADGQVDFSYSFREVTGEWPLGERWEGTAFIDQYEQTGSGNRGVGLTTSSGLIQLVSPPGERVFADPAAMAVLTIRGSGSSMERASFDVAEQRAIARLAQEARGEPVSVGSGSFRTSMGMSATITGEPPAPGGLQPVRVGGTIRTPQKIKHVDGVLPAAARQAGVFGMVIVEIVIGTDGTVQSAKVLRSIPMLDQAAIDAVKQWVYEPSLLNGVPVPVIITATLNFTQ